MKESLFVILLLIIVNVHGQEPRFDRFDISNGLSQNNINGLAIDDKGNVWAGTLDGLNRFNGYEFEVYKPLAGKSSHISGNHVIALGKGLNSDIWVTTRGGVLNQYVSATGKFRQFGDTIFQKTGVFPVSNLVQVNDSLLWYSDNNYAGVLNVNLEVAYTTEAPGFVSGIAMKGDSALIHGAFGIVLLELKDDGDQIGIQSERLSNFACHHLEPAGDKWYAVASRGIYELDGTLSHETLTLTFDESGSGDFSLFNVHDFAVHGETFWLGGNNLLIRFRKTGGEYVSDRFSYDPENSYSFKGYHVTSLEFDDIGNLWIGTLKNGLNHFNFKKNLFSHYNWGPQAMISPDADPVRAICKTASGDLWLGFDRKGVGVISKEGNQQFFSHFYTGNGRVEEIENVRTIFEDSNGTIWLGESGQLCVYNASLQRIEAVNQRFSWDWPYRCYFIEEKEPGILTITSPNSLGFVNLENGNLEKKSLLQYKNLVHGSVRDVVTDKYNNTWIAKDNNGILKIARSGSEMISLRKETHGLSDNKVYCFSVTGDSLWIGTNSGLNLLEIKSNKVVDRYFEEDGLVNNIVYSIYQDDEGMLWMSTNRGVSKFNPVNSRFKTFLAKDFFMDDAHFMDERGYIYYGGYTGVIAFHPGNIELPGFKTRTSLEGFRLFNQEILPGDTVNGRVLFEEPLDSLEMMTLKHHQNSFTLQFNAYPFDYPNQNTFRYKLEGLQDEWVYPEGNARHAAYTVVPPGDYTFRLQAAPFQQEFGPVTSLKIKVVPPFWQTSFFKVSILLLIVAGIVAGYRIRSRQVRKRNAQLKIRVEEQTRELKDQNKKIVEMSEQLHEADQSKLRFFTNVSHDFRTPLTLILAHLDNLSDNRASAVKTIRDNALRLLGLINQLIDLRKLDQGQPGLSISEFDIIGFASDIVDSFGVLARQKGINLQFFSSTDKLDVWLDRDKMDKIIHNLTSNAIKYTPEGKNVMVSIEDRGDTFCLSVEDEGIGISRDEVEHIFERFYRSGNGQPRATGHGIGLSIVKGFTEIQKGSIEVESDTCRGTEFRLLFPVGKHHFKDDGFKETVFDNANENPWLPADAIPGQELQPLIERFGEKRILVVEDNVDLSGFLKDMLEPFFNLRTAANGMEALEVMKDFVPDLIISDIMMPVMDGIEFCKQVKADIQTSHIPFVLLTAKIDAETRVEGFELGVDDYIEKPFDGRILFARLKALLENREKLKQHFQKSADAPPAITGLSTRDQQFITLVNKTIEEQYSNPSFNVEKLSEQLFMSRSAFYRKFKELTGITAVDYIRKIRLQKAAALLKQQVRASQVSEMVGFQSVAHFRKSFKDAFGETPGAWSKKAR